MIDIYLQLFNVDVWQEFKYYIFTNKLQYNNLYIGLYNNHNNDQILEDIKTYPRCYVDFFENKGGDIGWFLLQFKKYSSISHSPFFVKLHSKKSTVSLQQNHTLLLAPLTPMLWWPSAVNWRSDLLFKLIGNQETMTTNLSLFHDTNVGMVFPFYYDFDSTKSIEWIDFLLENLFDYTNKEAVRGSLFPAGSMFMSRYAIFKKYFTPIIIDYLYDKMPQGVIIEKEGGTICHALERIFGYLVTKENMRIRPI